MPGLLFSRSSKRRSSSQKPTKSRTGISFPMFSYASSAPADMTPQGQFSSSRLPGPTPFRLPSYPNERRARFNSNPVYTPSVHPLLAASNPPTIRYKLIDHPSHITIVNTHESLSAHTLAEAATKPKMASLILIFPGSGWQCHVRASNGSYVTIFDVLDTLYRFLRTNITEHEYRSLRADIQQRVNAAYERRYSRLQRREERHEERMKGVKRIDFLMESIRFRGLGATNNPNTWVVNLS